MKEDLRDVLEWPLDWATAGMDQIDWARTGAGVVPSGKGIRRILSNRGVPHFTAQNLTEDIAEADFSFGNMLNCHYEPFGEIALRMVATTIGVRLGVYGTSVLPMPIPNWVFCTYFGFGHGRPRRRSATPRSTTTSAW